MEDVENEKHDWMTLDEIAGLLRTSTDSVRRYVIKRKETKIVWLKQPFPKGKLLARRDTVERYVEELQKKTARRYNTAVSV